MNEIEFKRNIERVLVHADNDDVRVICGWTLLIPKKKAVEYANGFGNNTNPNEGFSSMDGGKICLTHNGGKIAFSRNEAQEIVNFIKLKYT